MSLWRGIVAAFTHNPGDVFGPVDSAERLTGQGRRVTADTAGLDERNIVKGWLSELGRVPNQQVFVHRSWGTVMAVVDDECGPAGVFWTDGVTTWHAVPPGAIKDDDLTPEQMTYVVSDALTSSGPPEWPQWRVLI